VGGGVRLHVGGPVWAVASANQGFRAPNLDDLTAQSSEGPGFQIGNPALRAESSITFEGGVQVRDRRATASAFAYATYIDDFITREVTTCPEPLQAACGDEAAVFRLINAESARVRGVELDAHVQLPAGVSLLGAATWTRGDRQTSAEPADPREPLSRLPPTHGVFAVRFAIARDYFAETAARWALAQDRLSAADLADARIPPGGTPGFGVVDVRAGARIRDDLRVTVAVENLANSRWRVHGSGVDGAGLNVVVAVSGGVGWR
jgi:iron complex outermembrane receptor protein/hemoglobin/transferrin/lactoferrin receptor protein